VQCLICWGNALRNGVSRQVRVKPGNFYRVDVSAADVVFVYATSRELVRLQSHLASQLCEGTRIVTAGSNFPDWEPVKVDHMNLLFLYVIPPG
jgi:hypothetical protein